MYRWLTLFLLVVGLSGCVGKASPMNIRRDAFKGYLSKSLVGTEENVNKTLPKVRIGKRAFASGRDELGNSCTIRVYADPKYPMLLHVITTTKRPCPDCGGSGIRGELISGINLRCLTCEGSGEGGSSTKRERHRVKPSDLAAGEPERE